MANRQHPTLGGYEVGEVPWIKVQGSRGGAKGTQLVVIPAGASTGSYAISLSSLNGKSTYYNNSGHQDVFLSELYGPLLDEHPDAMLIMGHRMDVTMPEDMPIADGMSVSLSRWEGLTFHMDDRTYRVRKFKDREDLRKRVANAVRSLSATAAKSREARSSVRIDWVAKWLLANVRPHAVARITETLATWVANPEELLKAKYCKVRLDLEPGDVVGVPQDVEVILTKEHLIRATVSITGDLKVTAASFFLGDIPDSAAAAMCDKEATVVADHPLLVGRRIAKAQVHTTQTRRSGDYVKTRYTEVTLQAPGHEVYDPSMIRGVAYAPGEAEAIVAKLVEGVPVDVMARSIIDAEPAAEMATRLHRLMVRNRGDDRANRDMYLTRGGGTIKAAGRLAPNATWRNDAVQITDLPESVAMTLRSRAMGRRARDLVDHPALEGLRVRAVHVVGEQFAGSAHPIPGYVAIHLEPDVALPIAA
jgi:hypothetical protein